MLRSCAALLLGLVGLAQSAHAMSSQQLGPHSYVVQGEPGPATAANRGFNSNAGFVITPAGVVVFDALGTPALARELLREIRRHTAAPIRWLVLSHYHADHVYGAAVFQAAGARVMAQRDGQFYLGSPLAAERLTERRQALAQWLPKTFALPQPDLWLDEGARFSLGGVDFELRHVGPGHTAEDLALLVVPDGVLYAGDLIYEGRVPFLGDSESSGWLQALERLQKTGAKVMVPGHGPVVANPSAALQTTRSYLLDLRRRMQSAVDNFVSFDQAYAEQDWSAWSALPAFAAANRGNAYTVYLEIEKVSLERQPTP